MPKVEIARHMGLTAQGAAAIVARLERVGLLARGVPQRGRVGQPAIPFEIAPNGAYALGLKIGRRSSELALVDFLGQVRAVRRIAFDWPDPKTVVQFAVRSTDRLRAALPEDDRPRLVGLGIAMPSELWSWQDLLDAPAGALDAWRGTDLPEQLAALTGLPVTVENDATAACGAELLVGRLPLPDFLHIFVGAFVGGGVVLGGRLFQGVDRNAGALGSMPLVAGTGTEARQLIDVASLLVLEERFTAAGLSAKSLRDPGTDWTEQAGAAALLRQWSADAGRALAGAVLAACSVIDFPHVVIDGSLPATMLADLVRDTRAALAAFDSRGLRLPEIVAGTVGPQARSIGAAALPLHKRFLADV